MKLRIFLISLLMVALVCFAQARPPTHTYTPTLTQSYEEVVLMELPYETPPPRTEVLYTPLQAIMPDNEIDVVLKQIKASSLTNSGGLPN